LVTNQKRKSNVEAFLNQKLSPLIDSSMQGGGVKVRKEVRVSESGKVREAFM